MWYNHLNMKHIFILNPKAAGKRGEQLVRDIHAIWSTSGEDYEIYETRHSGDAEDFVRMRCTTDPVIDAKGNRMPLRFYACGGDGTLCEVVNGVMSEAGGDSDTLAARRPRIEIGCIPMGTGNDFVRNFPASDFNDLMDQLRGEAVACDLIKYEAEPPKGPEGPQAKGAPARYCINMFNIGFDCAVVDKTDQFKRLPLINGSAAYLVSIAQNLILKRGEELRIEYPDGFVYEGKLLLLSLANGCFCGGGIKGLPLASTDDGRMDVSLVRDVPRRTFVKLFPKYQNGTHLDDPRVREILRYTQETSLVVTPKKGSMKLCVDGEISRTGKVRFSMATKAIRFIVPAPNAREDR